MKLVGAGCLAVLLLATFASPVLAGDPLPRPTTSEFVQAVGPGSKPFRIYLEPGQYSIWYTGAIYYTRMEPRYEWKNGVWVGTPCIVDSTGGTISVRGCLNPNAFPMPDRNEGEPYIKFGRALTPIPGTTRAAITIKRGGAAEIGQNIDDGPYWKGHGALVIHVLRLDAPTATAGATAPTELSLREPPARPSFFGLLFALCLFALPLQALVREVVDRSPGTTIGAILAAALVFEFALRRALANHRPLLELPSIGSPEGWTLIRYVIALLALAVATGLYVVPVVRRHRRSTTTAVGYAAVLVALLFLGQVRGTVYASTRPGGLLPLPVTLGLYAWLLLITVSAFAVAAQRPAGLARVPGAIGGTLASFLLAGWDTLTHRYGSRSTKVSTYPGEITSMKKKRDDELPAVLQDPATLRKELIQQGVEAAKYPHTTWAYQKRHARLNDNLKKVLETLDQVVRLHETEAKLRRQEIRSDHVDEFAKLEIENEKLGFEEVSETHKANIEEQKARREEIRAKREGVQPDSQPKPQESRYERFHRQIQEKLRLADEYKDINVKIDILQQSFAPSITAARADAEEDLAFELEQERDRLIKRIKRGLPLDG